MKSPFNTWFVKQFGKPVFKTPKAAQDAREELQSRRQQLQALEREMSAHEVYEAKKQAALYAWNANA
jgi:hypothetical protein